MVTSLINEMHGYPTLELQTLIFLNAITSVYLQPNVNS